MQAKISNSINIGDVILDLYQILDILGEGGFGKVYKVRHQNWNIDLAVKSPKPEIVAAAGGVENFEREAETWVNLGLHPHTVSCYYVRRVEGNPLVFAEYVDGGSLYDWIYQRKLYEGGTQAALKRILDIAIQFAWGLHYAHEQGLIHQDVKPSNVMLTPQGKVKVTDFGLASGGYFGSDAEIDDRSFIQSDASLITEGGAVTSACTSQIFEENPGEITPADSIEIGNASVIQGSNRTLMIRGNGFCTREYRSPEQTPGQILTRRADIWSWAVSVLEMFIGELTWADGIVANQVLHYYRQSEITSPHLPQMPVLVADLLERCLRQNPDERPHTILDVANELQEIYQQETGEVYPQQEAQTAKDIADSLNNRAVSLLDLGKQEEALKLWEQALKIQPQHPESTYNQGLVLWRIGKMDEDVLLTTIQQLQLSYPQNWTVNYFLALVHLERDDCSEAIKILEETYAQGIENKDITTALLIAKKRLPNSGLGHIFAGHTGVITFIDLSLNNELLLSGSWDNTLKLWEVATGCCLQTFEGHQSAVNSVCLSADGHFALSGSKDKTVKLWDVETGQCLKTFEGHQEEVYSVCLSADARLAVSSSLDYSIKFWDTTTGQCLKSLYPGRWAGLMEMSSDSRFLVMADPSEKRSWYIHIWQTEPEKHLHMLCHKYQYKITCLCLSSDNRFFVAGSNDCTLKLWELETENCLQTFSSKSEIQSVSLSSDSSFMISYGKYQSLKLWNTKTGTCLRNFQHQSSYFEIKPEKCVAISKKGDFFIYRDGVPNRDRQDSILKLWKTNLMNEPYRAPLILSKVFSSEEFIEKSVVFNQRLSIAHKAFEEKDFVTAAQQIRLARYEPGYNRQPEAFNLWTSLYIHLPRKNFVNIWEGVIFEGHNDNNVPLTVSLSRDNRLVLSGGGTGEKSFLSKDEDFEFDISFSLKLWETSTGQFLGDFSDSSSGYFRESYSLFLSSDGSLALSITSNINGGRFYGRHTPWIKIWDVVARKEYCTLYSEAQKVCVCISQDNRLVMSGNEDGTLHLWDLVIIKIKAYSHSSIRSFKGHTAKVTSVCLSVDNRFALSGSEDRTLKLWDVATGNCLKTFEGHTAKVTSVCLGVDNNFAFSGSSDHTLKVWNVTTGVCIQSLKVHENRSVSKNNFIYRNELTSIALSSDNRFIVSGSTDGTLKLWFLDWELEDKPPTDWDEGAKPYLEIFLTQHTPYAATLPEDREPTKEEITLSLSRSGTPTWTEADFQNLLYTLGCAGYGYLRPEGVRAQLEAMARGEQTL